MNKYWSRTKEIKMMIEVTCAILMKDEKILITQRSESMSHPLQWEFPGGKLKMGESPEHCIKREIEEELNIRIKVEQLLPSVTHEYTNNYIKLIPFICSLDSGEIILTEHKSYVWINQSELNEYELLEADQQIIEKMNDSLSY